MDNTQEVTVPPPLKSLQKKRSLVVPITAGIILVLLIATAAVVRYYPPVAESVNARMLPSELRTAEFISADAEGTVYTFADGSFVPVARGAGFIAYKDSTEQGLAVVLNEDGSFGIQLNGGTVVTSAERITSATLSPSGRQIAYAKHLPGKEGSKESADSEIILFFPATGKSVTLAPGFAPFYIDDNHLGTFANAGIYLRDLTTGEQTELLIQGFEQSLSAFSQSPDRTLVAWSDPVTKATHVYRIGETFTQVMQVPEYMPLFSLGNDALYRVKPATSGTSVLRYPLVDGSAPRSLFRLTPSLKIITIAL